MDAGELERVIHTPMTGHVAHLGARARPRPIRRSARYAVAGALASPVTVLRLATR